MHANFFRNNGSFGSVSGREQAGIQVLCNVPPSPFGQGYVEEPMVLSVMNFGAEENNKAPSYAGAAGPYGSGSLSQDAEEPLVLPKMKF